MNCPGSWWNSAGCAGSKRKVFTSCVTSWTWRQTSVELSVSPHTVRFDGRPGNSCSVSSTVMFISPMPTR